MLQRSNTFHGSSSSRFNLPARPQCSQEAVEVHVRLPPIKLSEASPSFNNDLARLIAQQAVGSDAKLRFSETTVFPPRKTNKTAISVHPKFLDEPVSERYYLPGYSPYLMDCNSEQRYFMSGYSGFVPRLRYLNGATFPVLTHDAIGEFDCARRGHVASLANTDPTPNAAAVIAAGSTSATGRGRYRGRRGDGVIYRQREGLLPNYLGHVPGHMRRFGGSFGRVTINARELPQ